MSLLEDPRSVLVGLCPTEAHQLALVISLNRELSLKICYTKSDSITIYRVSCKCPISCS